MRGIQGVQPRLASRHTHSLSVDESMLASELVTGAGRASRRRTMWADTGSGGLSLQRGVVSSL